MHTENHTCLNSPPEVNKNQVSTRLSGMLQNNYGNKGLDTLFGPGRISGVLGSNCKKYACFCVSDQKTLTGRGVLGMVKNIRVFATSIKNLHRQRGFEHTYMLKAGLLLQRKKLLYACMYVQNP